MAPSAGWRQSSLIEQFAQMAQGALDGCTLLLAGPGKGTLQGP